jgi:hypothetical protein
MGAIAGTAPVKLVCGVLAAGEPWLARARDALRRALGESDLESEVLPFDFTPYYEEEMGTGLLRAFLAFPTLVDPSALAAIKRLTNDLEAELAASRDPARDPRRPVNLDPGYLTMTKLVLASTKDSPHRVCLGAGIYAEITLFLRRTATTPLPWTYPDFRSGRYDPFLLRARALYSAAMPDGTRR